MNKIKEIILNDNYRLIDKIILIYREVDKDNDVDELSAALDLPVEILKNYTPVPRQEKKNGKSNIQEYIDLFSRMYEKLNKVKFKYTGKEIGQLKNIIKQIKFSEWKKILVKIFNEGISYQTGNRKQKRNWKWIIEKLSPSIIYNNINFIMTELYTEAGKKWEGFRNDKKK